MKAEAIFREKRVVANPRSGQLGIAEIRVWKIPRSPHYPEGRKYSLFLTSEGKTLVGIDNHRPKGPHLHLGEQELSFQYKGDDALLNDFWDFVRKAGFEP